jgi:hypothetical protein
MLYLNICQWLSRKVQCKSINNDENVTDLQQYCVNNCCLRALSRNCHLGLLG